MMLMEKMKAYANPLAINAVFGPTPNIGRSAAYIQINMMLFTSAIRRFRMWFDRLQLEGAYS